MQPETERRLAAEALDRIGRGALPEAEVAMPIDGRRYTCAAAPGDYVTLDIAGVPVLLMRANDGTVQGPLNTCRHRGARLLEGVGQVGKAFVCPYHNWAYDRCGVLRAPPASEHFPGIVVGQERLVRFPTEERDGLVWLLLDPAATLDLDEALGPLGPELAAFGLAGYHHRGSYDWTKRMNWKLGVDRYLPRVLPRAHPAPRLHRQDALRHGLPLRGLRPPRRSIEDQRGSDPETWQVLPHATIVYRLFPNPARSGVTSCRFSFASPADDASERDWEKMMRLALGMLDSEDFAVMEGVQANLAAGLQREIVFGRNEIGLQNFHEVRDAAGDDRGPWCGDRGDRGRRLRRHRRGADALHAGIGRPSPRVGDGPHRLARGAAGGFGGDRPARHRLLPDP